MNSLEMQRLPSEDDQVSSLIYIIEKADIVPTYYDETESIAMMKSPHISDERWSAEISINGQLVNFLLDTGAPVNGLPLEVFDKVFDRCLLERSDRKLTGPSGERLDIKGMCTMNFKYGYVHCNEKLYIIKKLKLPFLSLKLCEGLKIIQRIGFGYCREIQFSAVQIIKEFPDLFKSLGCLKGEFEIKLKENSKPSAIFHAKRVSLTQSGKLQNKLREMIELHVIKAVQEPTEWCSPLVIVSKPNGDIRPCVDLSKLNMCIEREIQHLPSVDYMLAQLAGAKFFSKLDTNLCFWQVKLSKKSQLLTTFLTPIGRFCFERLPFGISSAPEYFQREIQKLLEGVPGCVSQTDDIVIHGRDMLEHDVNLRKALKRLVKGGVTLNHEKCEIGTTSVHFLCHFINQDGIHADDSKIKTIDTFPIPSNVAKLRKFLGLVNYLAKFIPNLSVESEPLNELLKNETIFQWDRAQQCCFVKLKELATNCPVLKVYNPRHRTKISSDASSYGLVAVIKQCDDEGTWKPVAYASRTFTSTERDYIQIEQDLLGIVWAVNEKFRYYVQGLEFEIETGRKSLFIVLKSKNFYDLTPRLEKFRMTLMSYKFTMQFTPGKRLVIEDALLPNPIPSTVFESKGDDLNKISNHFSNELPTMGSQMEKDERNLETVGKHSQRGCSYGDRTESVERPSEEENQIVVVPLEFDPTKGTLQGDTANNSQSHTYKKHRKYRARRPGKKPKYFRGFDLY